VCLSAFSLLQNKISRCRTAERDPQPDFRFSTVFCANVRRRLTLQQNALPCSALGGVLVRIYLLAPVFQFHPAVRSASSSALNPYSSVANAALGFTACLLRLAKARNRPRSTLSKASHSDARPAQAPGTGDHLHRFTGCTKGRNLDPLFKAERQ
jgi:hypothetical protein